MSSLPDKPKSSSMQADLLRMESEAEGPLDVWLERIVARNPPPVVDYAFACSNHRSEFLAQISEYSEDLVRIVLRGFLFPSGTFGLDRTYHEALKSWRGTGDSPSESEFVRRRERYFTLVDGGVVRPTPPPWEGNTWVLDLLPHFPRQALEGLRAYFLAHAQHLPDGRLNGLDDATAIVRARYITVGIGPHRALAALRSLDPREFEHLVERLYHARGYATTLTRRSRDGGYDVMATCDDPGRREHLLIECKLWEKKVGVRVVRQLLGTVAERGARGGVLVTTSSFTRDAIDFGRDNRLDLVASDALLELLNEHLGARWPERIDRRIAESQRQAGGHGGPADSMGLTDSAIEPASRKP